MDKKYLEITKDSILPALIDCHGENHPLVSLSYLNIGNTLDYNSWAENSVIEKYYLKCLKIENQLAEPSEHSANIYSEIGEFFGRAGDPSRSLYYNEMALQSLKSYRRNNSLVLIYHNIARANYLLENYEKSLENHLLAIEIAKKVYKKNNHILVSYIFEEAGESLLKLNRYKEAENYLLKSLEITSTHFPDNLELIDQQRVKLSKVYTQQGRFVEAESILNTVKSNYLNYSKEDVLVYAHWINENIAINYFEAGNLENALRYFQNSLKVQVSNLSEDLLKNPIIINNRILNSRSTIDALRGKTECLFAIGKKEKDDEYLESVIDATKKLDSLIKFDLTNDWQEGSQMSLLRENRKFYQFGINAALELSKSSNKQKYIGEAYELSSRIKSQLLFRGLQYKKKNEAVIPEHTRKMQDSLEEIVLDKEEEYASAMMQNHDLNKTKLLTELFNARETLDIFKRENGVANLLSYDDVVFAPELEIVQQRISEDEAILEFHFHDNELLSFLITSDSISYSQSRVNQEEIIGLYDEITTAKKIQVKELSSQILKVLNSSQFHGKQLIIIPDKELLQIPFEMLEYNGKLLIESFDVSYEYSSGFLTDEKELTYTQNYVGFASDYNDPSFTALKDNYTTSPEGILLSPLIHALGEVESAAVLLGGKANVNSSATKANFESQSNGAQVLHLALHGVLSESFPDQSSLVFSSEEDDHLLSAAEIYHMDINTELTVLSACNTGVGPVRVGDGVRSLARSFIHAGSESVITSLWEISDVTTEKILKSFYTYLSEGKTKSAALRQAKMEFIAQASPTQRHPKYWAHLILVGDAGSIQLAGLGELTNIFVKTRHIFIAAICILLLILFRFFGSAKNLKE